MDEIQTKLRRMVEKEGADVVSLAGMCDLMLKKHLADHPEAARALAFAVERGVAQQIRKTPNAMAREMLEPNWRQQLMSGAGFSAEQAQWIINSWADALDAAPDVAVPNPHDETAKKKSRAPDVDVALMIVLMFGLGFHVLVLIGFSFIIELYGDPDLVQIKMQDVLSFYAVFLPISAAFSLLPYIALTTMYGMDSSDLFRYLRNYFCLFAFASAAFMFAIMLRMFVGLPFGMFFAATTLGWLMRFYGMRVFIITSILHATQYLVYFALVMAQIVIVLHNFGIKDDDNEIEIMDPKQRIKKNRKLQLDDGRRHASLFGLDEAGEAWTDRLLAKQVAAPRA